MNQSINRALFVETFVESFVETIVGLDSCDKDRNHARIMLTT
jgi:hypothetical protein